VTLAGRLSQLREDRPLAKREPIGRMVVDFGTGGHEGSNPFDDEDQENSNDNPDDFFTKVAGVRSGSDRKQKQEAIGKLAVGSPLRLEREPDNEFDPNAIKIMTLDGVQLGYLNEYRAETIFALMDQGHSYQAVVSSVTGGQVSTRTGKPRGMGVNIRVRRMAGSAKPARSKAAKAEEFGEGSFWTLVVIMIVVIVLLALVRVALF
jgi:hypothetical protein